MDDAEKQAWQKEIAFSFELDEMAKIIPVGDDFAAAIRGHLFIESVLIHLLQEAFEDPTAIDIDRIQFNLKVDFCAAMRILPRTLVAPMKKINAIRNKVAHNIRYTISQDDIRSLFNSFDTQAQSLISEQRKTPDEIDLSLMVKVAAILADIGRHEFVEWKRRRHEAGQACATGN